MQKKHTYSPNHKVVAGPHNFSMPAGNAAGAAPGGGMDAGGGPPASFADGGAPEGGGLKGTLDDVGTAIKQTASDLFSGPKSNPVASGNKDEPYEGVGGAARKSALDSQIEDQSK